MRCVFWTPCRPQTRLCATLLGQCKHSSPRSVNYCPRPPPACLRVMKSKKRDTAGRLSMPRRPRTEPTTTLLLSFFLFNSLSFLVDLAKERKWRGRRARKLFTSRSHGGAAAQHLWRWWRRTTHTFSHTQLNFVLLGQRKRANERAGAAAMNQPRPPKDNFPVRPSLSFFPWPRNQLGRPLRGRVGRRLFPPLGVLPIS